jgi:hypothetical protein
MERPCERLILLPAAQECIERMKDQPWILLDCMRIVTEYAFGIELKFQEIDEEKEVFSWQGPCTAGFMGFELSIEYPGRYLHAYWGESLSTAMTQTDTKRVRTLFLNGSLHCFTPISEKIALYHYQSATLVENVFNQWKKIPEHPELLEIVKYARSHPANFFPPFSPNLLR